MKKFYLFILLAAASLRLNATIYTLAATLNGAQVPTSSTVTGSLTGTYNDATNELSYNLSYGAFSTSVGAVHFHGPAAAGAGAGVRLDIGTANPISLSGITISAAFGTEIISGLWYVNIHTGAFGGGEIRGQVLATVLSVDLVQFTSSKKNDVIQLDWTTAAETKNKGFQIERSANGKTFEKIGFVEGIGTSKSMNTYTFIDAYPLSINYYRLRQIDANGAETVSKIINNRLESNGKLLLSPNPTRAALTLNFEDVGDAQLTVFDYLGRIVLSKNMGTNTQQIDVSALNAGNYVLKIQSASKIYSEKFVKY